MDDKRQSNAYLHGIKTIELDDVQRPIRAPKPTTISQAKTQAEIIEVMREALGQIARSRKDCGKPQLTRRDMQTEARAALIAAGYPSWAANPTGKV